MSRAPCCVIGLLDTMAAPAHAPLAAASPGKASGMPALPRIAEFADELVAIRRDLHAHPEIGFEEVRTSGIVAEKLASWGVEVHRGIGKTGVVGVLRGRDAGRRRAGLRADMNGLPMARQSTPPYRSSHPLRSPGCDH